jgi:hypothetical protein
MVSEGSKNKRPISVELVSNYKGNKTSNVRQLSLNFQCETNVLLT